METNERGRYNAIMIEITYGAFLSCWPTSIGPNLMSRRLELWTCQLECLAESSGTCGCLHKADMHSSSITLNIEKAK